MLWFAISLAAQCVHSRFTSIFFPFIHVITLTVYWGYERCQSASDLHSILYLNASPVEGWDCCFCANVAAFAKQAVSEITVSRLFVALNCQINGLRISFQFCQSIQELDEKYYNHIYVLILTELQSGHG